MQTENETRGVTISAQNLIPSQSEPSLVRSGAKKMILFHSNVRNTNINYDLTPEHFDPDGFVVLRAIVETPELSVRYINKSTEPPFPAENMYPIHSEQIDL